MNVTEANSASGPSLTDAQQREIAEANRRAVKIRRAARVASFNGWATAIVAVLAAPFALFDATSLFIAVGSAVIAWNEFRGRRRLLEFDPSAATLLGWNQVALLTLVVLYCGWMLCVGLVGESPLAAELQAQPELAEVMGSLDGFEGTYRALVVLVYGTVIVLSLVFQGLNAVYYFSRRKYLQEYLANTSAWVRQVQRLAAPS